MNPTINAPITKGQKLGEIIYTQNDIEVGRSDIIAESDVEKASFGQIAKKLSILWFD